jgi:hypothetical protein
MKLEIARVEAAFGGVSFGAVGPYEKVIGRAFADVDPTHPLNAGIVNLGNSLRNAAGRVEYWCDFYLLRPVDLRKGSRRIFYGRFAIIARLTIRALTTLSGPGRPDQTDPNGHKANCDYAKVREKHLPTSNLFGASRN